MKSFRSAQLETIQALVSAGLGLSLVPAMAVRDEPCERELEYPLDPVTAAGAKDPRGVAETTTVGACGEVFLELMARQFRSRTTSPSRS